MVRGAVCAWWEACGDIVRELTDSARDDVVMIKVAARFVTPVAADRKKQLAFKSMINSRELSDFQRLLETHASLADGKSEGCVNEHATELVLVIPFIRILGYDPEDLAEVYPQFDTAPCGGRRAPVDFAIFREARGALQPFILVEAKVLERSNSKPFGQDDVDQLLGYMGSTTATFGLLTDGNRCEWYRKPPNKGIAEQNPFLTHRIFELMHREIEWLSAISKESKTRDDLDWLAWRLSLENRIREWLASTFEDPVDPAIINKAVGLKVPAKDHAVVSEAARAVWASLQIECPPPPISSDIHLEIAQEPQLVLGDGEVLTPEKLPRAWRIGTEQWRKTDDASELVATVLSELLGCDTRRKAEKRLAQELNLNSFDSDPGERGYKKIDGFSSVYCNTGVSNVEKRKLLERIAKEVEIDPSVGHPVTQGKTIECWLPTGGSRKKRKSP